MYKFLVLTVCVSFSFLSCSTKSSNVESETDSTSSTASAKPSPETAVAWKVVGVKDEFGDVTPGKSLIAADFKGTMSNSATQDADLTVQMQLSADSILIAQFFEYNRTPAAKLPKNEYINVKAKVSSGEVIEIKMLLFQNMLGDQDRTLLHRLLKDGTPIKLIVDLTKVSSHESTIYNFTIDPAGLKEAMAAR